jgi:hypothetical protein
MSFWQPSLAPVVLHAITACTPVSPPPEAATNRAPVVALGSASAAAPTSAAATTKLPDKLPPYTPCVAEMFDHKPGNHGLTAFEDQGGLYGFRDGDGKAVIAPRFRFAYPFSPAGLAAVVDDNGPAFIDPSGQVLARAFPYDNGPDYFTEGLARIVGDEKVGFIAPNGRIVIEPRFHYASAFCHGRAAVCDQCQRGSGDHGPMEGGPWGFIDRQGRLAVPMKFDSVRPFEGDQTQAVLDGKPVVIDKHGKGVDASKP